MTRLRRYNWRVFAVVFAALIGLSLAYDQLIAQYSTTRATLIGRHTKCGSVTNSGPKEPPVIRSLKTYFLMARLDDGRLVRVERTAGERPPCGALLDIEERVTPWGSVWYWTAR